MRTSKILLFLLSVSLLAAGCSKKMPVQTNPPLETPVAGESAIVPVPKDWVTFFPGIDEIFNMAIPKTWVADATNTSSNFTIRSRSGADGTKTGDAYMKFSTRTTTKKSASEQLAEGTKTLKNVSKPGLGRTDSGLDYAYVTYTDTTNKYKSLVVYAVDLKNGKFVHIETATLETNPIINTVVKRIRIWK